MREIKFRAWDKKRDIMIDSESFSFDWVNGLKYSKHFVVMQFTGLKDKNGKEIFEGDIVSDGKLKSVVVWKNDGFGINNGKYNLSRYLGGNEEVIGNKFENPKLLK